MQVFRCDRCGRIIEYGDRFLGRLNGQMADLCHVCYDEFCKDKASVERLHKKQIEVLSMKYGLTPIKEYINKED